MKKIVKRHISSKNRAKNTSFIKDREKTQILFKDQGKNANFVQESQEKKQISSKKHGKPPANFVKESQKKKNNFVQKVGQNEISSKNCEKNPQILI